MMEEVYMLLGKLIVIKQSNGKVLEIKDTKSCIMMTSLSSSRIKEIAECLKISFESSNTPIIMILLIFSSSTSCLYHYSFSFHCFNGLLNFSTGLGLDIDAVKMK